MNFSSQKRIRKIFLTACLSLLFLFGFSPKTQAAWIPGLDPLIKQGLEEIEELIQGTIRATEKLAAVNALMSQVNNLAGKGPGGGASFVTNWKDAIINEPKNETIVQMNDYLSEVTGGRNSYSSYKTQGFGSSGASNYFADLSNSVRKLDNSEPKVTYEGDPEKMLDVNNFKKLEEWNEGINNRYMFEAAFNEKQRQIEEEVTLVAQTEKIANDGFKGTSDGASGDITSPGILTKEMIANAQNLPNSILANAQTIPEVITASVNLIINRTFTQGFSSVQRSASKAADAAKRATSSEEDESNEEEENEE